MKHSTLRRSVLAVLALTAAVVIGVCIVWVARSRSQQAIVRSLRAERDAAWSTGISPVLRI